MDHVHVVRPDPLSFVIVEWWREKYSLIRSIQINFFLYSANSLCYTNAYSQAFFKIFTTFDKIVVQQCQFYMGLLPIHLLIDLRKLNFPSVIWSHIAEVKAMCSLDHLAKWTDRDFKSLLAKFGLSFNSKRTTYKPSVYSYFQTLLDMQICLTL